MRWDELLWEGDLQVPHTRLSGEEIDRRGQELYETRIRAEVETAENIGKIVSIDVETGEYAVADDPLAASAILRQKHADAAIAGFRIGYNAVYAVGGSIERTPQT
jgi:hypothetical protein